MILNAIVTMTSTVINIVANSTTELALAANGVRLYAIFINDSDKPMYLRLGATDAAEHEGIRVSASGGSYEITKDNLYRGVVQVICEASGKKLLVTEGVS